jgi:hypothetical protein
MIKQMKQTFLAIHPLLGTKHKPSPQHLLERSVFYWWWAYLKRNTEYIECCNNNGKGSLANLYGDFGDVRSDDFRTWWGGSVKRGSNLFAEQSLDLTVKKIDALTDWDESWGSNVLVVAINKDIGRRKLQSIFAKVLKSEHEGKKGRKAMGKVESTAMYPLHRNFSVYNLKRMLLVYDTVLENEKLPKSSQKALWKIGEELKLVPSALPQRGDNIYDTRRNHNTLTMTVSRYVSTAKRIIANTSNGEFPNSDN